MENTNKDALVLEGERVDDLQLSGLRLIQNPNWFCFGVDAVLLADFSKDGIKKGASVVDFCSGNGIIPVLLSEKTDAKEIFCFEIQKEVANLAERNMKYNLLDNKIKVFSEDIKDALKFIKPNSIDYITCNPPYKENLQGLKNKDDIITIARHEVLLNLEDIIISSEKILKPQGKISLIHRPERLADIICLMRKYKIEPKRIRFVHPYPKKTATMILIEGAKAGGKNLFFEAPLYIYNEDKTYTDEINKIYGRN